MGVQLLLITLPMASSVSGVCCNNRDIGCGGFLRTEGALDGDKPNLSQVKAKLMTRDCVLKVEE